MLLSRYAPMANGSQACYLVAGCGRCVVGGCGGRDSRPDVLQLILNCGSPDLVIYRVIDAGADAVVIRAWACAEWWAARPGEQNGQPD